MQRTYGRLLDVYAPAIDVGPCRIVSTLTRGRPMRVVTGPVAASYPPHDRAKAFVFELAMDASTIWRFQPEQITVAHVGRDVQIRVDGQPEVRAQ